MNNISNTKLSFPVDKKITFGRDPSCDVLLKGIGVSRFHAVVFFENGNWIIKDLNSTFGTRLNEKPVTCGILNDNDIIMLGICKFKINLTNKGIILEQIKEIHKQKTETSDIDKSITIGRDPSNLIFLPHPMVSRFHATFRKHPKKGYILEDHNSTNGTFVNGKPVHISAVEEGDVIQIGPYRLYLDEGKLHHAQDFNKIKIEAFGVTVRKKNHVLLDNISINIEPGEFVAILGPSGAGKSTLAQALTGQIELTNGTVYYNGLPMREFCSAFYSAIGFVSQQNLLRPELSVIETFKEQCILRLLKDSLYVEQLERINQVMDLLDLSKIKHRRISRLSGGEVKRVHFGIELLSSPTLIFLDEPLAGLDPGLIHKFMLLFRSISTKGHTILLATHTLEQIDLCDRILFLNEGKLVFNGPPQKLKEQINSQEISKIYEKAKELKAEEKIQNAKILSEKTIRENQKKIKIKIYKPKSISVLKQVILLTIRYFKILFRDTRTSLLMFLQAPLIALLLAFVYKPDNDFLPISFYFCISISAIWMGGMNSVREIAREWLLIEREFRIGLSVFAYGFSKIIVFCIYGAMQAIFFGFCLNMFFKGYSFNLNTLVLLCAACCSGSLLGLCISSFSRNVNMAISFLPIIFIPQIFFSGILVPFDETPLIGNILSHLTIERPIFSMFKKLVFFEERILSLNDWTGFINLSLGLIILIFTAISFRKYIIGKDI